MKKEKAPFKVLFSNDTTNILTCVSLYHKKGEPFREEMLEATVDETAETGVEVHMLQPGLGWIPWWPSKVYPIEEHYKWSRKKYGEVRHNSFLDYVLNGGDFVKVFVKRCKQRELTPFISLRLNDAHHGSRAVCRFDDEHPEYRIGPNHGVPQPYVHNWAIPEVRDYKFAFIKELCSNYDIDGFELDFMRHPSFFRIDETTTQQRVEIITGFVKKVRELLDQTAKSGQHRWLCVRVPCYLEAHDPIGIDLPSMVNAGVDMVNLSASYFTVQQTDLPEIRKMIPDTAVYLEMTHCTATGRRLTKSGGDNFLFRRTTDEQFYTTAHLAYARGADGVSAFNFVYYREHGTPGRGPFNEPPFHVFNHLDDPEWLAKQSQHYFLSTGWHSPSLPKKISSGQKVTFTMDMAPPEGGWKTDARLRIQGKISLNTSEWKARFNGVDLKPNSNVSEPYPNPYQPMLGKPEELRAWTVPVSLLKDGKNKIEITMVEGEPVEIIFLDLAVK